MFVTDGDKRIATIDTLTVDNKVAVGTLVDVIRYQYDNHLGSASLELDQNADIITYEEYHPFGTTSYRSGRSETETSLKRYKYVGKERDEETGLYYYGARFYDPAIARWTSVDPLAEKYQNLSLYNYVANNPMKFIDPDGREIHNYSVDKAGNIKLEEETTDKFDMLYTKSDWDSGKKDNGEKVNNQNILSDLDVKNKKGDLNIARDYGEGSIDDMFKVFKFLADETKTEWGLVRYQYDKYALYTSHDSDDLLNPKSDLNLPNVNALVHNHPRTENREWSERMSMGDIYRPDTKEHSVAVPSDWSTKIHGGAPFEFYTYFPKSKNLYYVGKYEVTKIKKISNFKSFYFGALNHR